MESLDTLLRCDCCWCSRLPGIPPTTTSTSTTREEERARAFAHCSCVLSTHSQETLTSVYADLKGGAGQRGGCNRGSRSERTPPNTSSSFCVASFSSLENREELLLRLSLFTSTAVMSVYDKCWWKGWMLIEKSWEKNCVTKFWMRHFFWENVIEYENKELLRQFRTFLKMDNFGKRTIFENEHFGKVDNFEQCNGRF